MTQEPIKTVDAKTLKEWLAKGEAKLIDVREAIENKEERIPDAELIPLSAFDASKIHADGKKIVFHCLSGKRSQKACEEWIKSGAPDAIHLEGGINAWKSMGLETVKGDKICAIPVQRQVNLATGFLVLLGIILGVTLSPYWLVLSGIIGAVLIFAGMSGRCYLSMLINKMPWNK